MEISSTPNNQSFGSFIRPKNNKIVKHFFTVRGLRVPNDEFIERGLNQLEKEHIGDVHYNFMYNQGEFSDVFGLDTVVIVPKSKIAKKLTNDERFTVSSGMRITSEIDKMMSEIDKFRNADIKSPLKRLAADIKLRLMLRRYTKYFEKNPKELLPDNLRYAADLVTDKEKEIAKLI